MHGTLQQLNASLLVKSFLRRDCRNSKADRELLKRKTGNQEKEIAELSSKGRNLLLKILTSSKVKDTIFILCILPSGTSERFTED